MTSASPNVVSRLGVGLGAGEVEPGAENSFYIQSSNHSYDGHSNNDEDGVKILGESSVKEPRRQFKVREPEELGTSLLQHSSVADQQTALQGSTGGGTGSGLLNDSIENQGGNLTKAINESSSSKQQ